MLRECLYNRRNAILLLPYVAIVKEKISSLSFFEDEFGIVIEEYAASKGESYSLSFFISSFIIQGDFRLSKDAALVLSMWPLLKRFIHF